MKLKDKRIAIALIVDRYYLRYFIVGFFPDYFLVEISVVGAHFRINLTLFLVIILGWCWAISIFLCTSTWWIGAEIMFIHKKVRRPDVKLHWLWTVSEVVILVVDLPKVLLLNILIRFQDDQVRFCLLFIWNLQLTGFLRTALITFSHTLWSLLLYIWLDTASKR